MKISYQISEKFSIIKFEVDQVLGYEAQEFQDAILDSLDKNASVIIVDLSRVKFISSWGIGMLIHGLATTTNRGKSFKIVGLADNVMDVFKKVKIDTVLNIYKTVDMAKSG
jgi:anti-sigma B factor antagonist